MLTEQSLKEVFWKFYQSRAKGGYMFEVSMENNSRKSDLITIETYQGKFQINAFEFKLNDFNKVLEQAKANARYCNKSWIVMPENKANYLRNHAQELQSNGIGAITVEDGGRWNLCVQAPFRKDCILNQEILKIAEYNTYKPYTNHYGNFNK